MNISDIVDEPSNSSQDIPAHFPDNFSIQGESINISPRRDDFPNPPSSLEIPSPNSIISLSQTINTLDIFPDKVKSPSSSSSIKETPHLASKTAEVSPQARNDDKVSPQASNDDTIVPGEEMYPGEDRTVSLSPAPHQVLKYHFKEISCVQIISKIILCKTHIIIINYWLFMLNVDDWYKDLYPGLNKILTV